MFNNSFKILSISFFVAYSPFGMADNKKVVNPINKNVVSPMLTAQTTSQQYYLDSICPKDYTANAGDASCINGNCGAITIKTSHNGGFKNIATYTLANQGSPQTFQLAFTCYWES